MRTAAFTHRKITLAPPPSHGLECLQRSPQTSRHWFGLRMTANEPQQQACSTLRMLPGTKMRLLRMVGFFAIDGYCLLRWTDAYPLLEVFPTESEDDVSPQPTRLSTPPLATNSPECFDTCDPSYQGMSYCFFSRSAFSNHICGSRFVQDSCYSVQPR